MRGDIEWRDGESETEGADLSDVYGDDERSEGDVEIIIADVERESGMFVRW